jgi:PKD repeat protein
VDDTPPTKGHTACSPTDRFAAACTFNAIAANYKFDDVTTTSGTTDPTAVPVVAGITLSSVTANGVGTNPSTNGNFSYEGWGVGAANGELNYAGLTGALNTSKYYEFTVTPDTSNSMTIAGLSFIVDRSATGPRTWAVRASTNAFVSNIPTASIAPANTNLAVQPGNVFFLKFDTTTSQKGSKLSFTGTTFTNVVTPITFRIYAYNAEDALGTFGIDSVFVTGTTGLVENTENYMDYSYCSKMYTFGQKDRMRAALESNTSSRNNLWSAANLVATGVSNPAPCKPYPDFYADKLRICKGDVVKFTKSVLYGTETTRTWTFEGGTPATSTSATPINVTYNTPGLYKVTLSASNAAGADSVVKTGYIRVDEDWADIDYNGTYTEDFQNTSNFYWDWQVRNYDNNAQTWSVSNFAGYQSSKCVMMSGYNNYDHDVDDLISPSYDLTYTSAINLTFKCAAASKAGSAADVNDVLKVYVSTNCGTSWNLRATFKDSTLINNGFQPTYFVPGTNSVWTERSVPIPASFATANTRFKFEYTAGSASNNVYLDYINLSGAVGVHESVVEGAGLSIYPNPSNETATIAYHLANKADTKIEVVDVLGKKVFVTATNGQLEGDYNIQISKHDQHLTNGIYFVKFSIGNESMTKKLIITE